jgi:hypothetical protein
MSLKLAINISKGKFSFFTITILFTNQYYKKLYCIFVFG